MLSRGWAGPSLSKPNNRSLVEAAAAGDSWYSIPAHIHHPPACCHVVLTVMNADIDCPGIGHCSVGVCAGLQQWPMEDLLVQYSVWRDSITAVVQIEPPAPESRDGLGTFALSVMPPGEAGAALASCALFMHVA